MFNQETKICRACATGNKKHAHSNDPNSCVYGRDELLRNLPPEEQIKELMIHERLSPEMANHISLLARDRNVLPVDILSVEGIKLA
jgi:hypothetical protein